MKIFIAAFLIIVGMSAAYAGGFMLLHVGDSNGNGGGGGCSNQLDFSQACNSQYLL